MALSGSSTLDRFVKTWMVVLPVQGVGFNTPSCLRELLLINLIRSSGGTRQAPHISV